MGTFEGVAEIYEKSRRGYPLALRQWLVERGLLDESSFVVDLGAGTGQMARLLAPVAARCVAVEPDGGMLGVGERVTAEWSTVGWVQGRDGDLATFFTAGEIDLVTVGNAFHHMDQPRLLSDLDSLVGVDGAVCIATSSVPVWLQESEWSRALRAALETELGPVGRSGVPDVEASEMALAASAFSTVSTWSFEQLDHRTCEGVVGDVVSSASGALGQDLVDRLRRVIAPFARDGLLSEAVRGWAVVGSRP